jgi:CRISPR/Cas system-associated protein Csm6
MTIPQDPELTRPWRTSSHSDTGGQCVEVAQAGTTCAVRDSRDPDGRRLSFTHQAWAAFTGGIKHGPCRISASERILPA